MKKNEKELDVDFIGIQGEKLTKDEERAISEYLKNKKIKANATPVKTRNRTKNTALTA